MERHRLDHWLKLVCVYRHRSDATEACKGGHVRLNGTRAKASSPVREGDMIEITTDHVRLLVVVGLPEHTISKQVARTMYRDESPPRPAEPPRMATRERGAGRPTKRERREMEDWRRK